MSLDAVLRALSGFRPTAHVVTRGIIVAAIELTYLGAVKVYGDRSLAAKVAHSVDTLLVW